MKNQKRSLLILSSIFVFGIACSIAIFILLRSRQVDVAKKRFEVLAESFMYALDARLLRNQVVLQGCSGLIRASEYVSTAEWSQYVRALNTPEFFPAIRWIGMAKVLKTEEETVSFVRAFQEKENSNFHIWPENGVESIPLIYLYPITYRDLIGYNLLQNREIASLLKNPIASSNLLVSPDLSFSPTDPSQSALLLFFPSGDRAWSVLSLDLVVIVDQIAKQINFEDINIEIFRGKSTNAQDMIFERGGVDDPYPIYTYANMVQIGNRTLTFVFKSTSQYRDSAISGAPYLIFIGLLIIVGVEIYLLYREMFQRAPQTPVQNGNPFQANPLVDSMQEAAFAVDNQGKIALFNKAAERIFGYNSTDVIGKLPLESFIDQGSLGKNSAEFGKALNKELKSAFEIFSAQADKGTPNQVQWTFIKKDQSRISLIVDVTGIRNEKNELIGYLGVAQEIKQQG